MAQNIMPGARFNKCDLANFSSNYSTKYIIFDNVVSHGTISGCTFKGSMTNVEINEAIHVCIFNVCKNVVFICEHSTYKDMNYE
jgi:hypothetical protein